jgi:hypothetical protein
MSEHKLKTLAEYHAALAAKQAAGPEMSGIACPDCEEDDGVERELAWGERSMFSMYPPMRRLNCLSCNYSTVVPV